MKNETMRMNDGGWGRPGQGWKGASSETSNIQHRTLNIEVGIRERMGHPGSGSGAGEVRKVRGIQIAARLAARAVFEKGMQFSRLQKEGKGNRR